MGKLTLDRAELIRRMTSLQDGMNAVARAKKGRRGRVTTKGSVLSRRGTYDEDPLLSCQNINFDPEAIQKGYMVWENGQMKKVREPVPHIPDVRSKITKIQGIEPIEIGGRTAHIERPFISHEGPRAGPWVEFGKGPFPGATPPPIITDFDDPATVMDKQRQREAFYKQRKENKQVDTGMKGNTIHQNPKVDRLRTRPSKGDPRR